MSLEFILRLFRTDQSPYCGVPTCVGRLALPRSLSPETFMRFTRFLVAVAAFSLALPLAAQAQSDKSTAKPGKTILLADSLELETSPELQKSLDALAAAVQALALRVANDPQLRIAAIQVASGFVLTAQQAMVENSVVIQEALKTAAERIATAQAAEARQPKKIR